MESITAATLILILAISSSHGLNINSIANIGVENFCKRNLNLETATVTECEFPYWGVKQAYPSDCQKYWFCGFNGWELLTCSFNMYYNTYWNSCWPDASGCVYKACEEGQKYALEFPEKNCNRYIRCLANDTSILEQCPPGTFFDVKLQNCTENAALCFPSLQNRCQKNEKGAKFSYPLDCSGFVVCDGKDETGKLKFCDPHTFFDIKTKSCLNNAFVCGGIKY